MGAYTTSGALRAGVRVTAGQEDQLGALGLVLNAAVLWTTRYPDASVEQLRALPAEEREHPVLDEDVARLSPLKHGLGTGRPACSCVAYSPGNRFCGY
ncbi:transposase [Streptomyces sp. NBC_00846]|nr:transposase [Streptomyces sp. NBC_00846]